MGPLDSWVFVENLSFSGYPILLPVSRGPPINSPDTYPEDRLWQRTIDGVSPAPFLSQSLVSKTHTNTSLYLVKSQNDKYDHQINSHEFPYVHKAAHPPKQKTKKTCGIYHMKPPPHPTQDTWKTNGLLQHLWRHCSSPGVPKGLTRDAFTTTAAQRCDWNCLATYKTSKKNTPSKTKAFPSSESL